HASRRSSDPNHGSGDRPVARGPARPPRPTELVMKRRRVVITGLGAVTPLGLDLGTTWDALLAGRSGAGPITAFDASQHPTRFACSVKGFDAHAHFAKPEA